MHCLMGVSAAAGLGATNFRQRNPRFMRVPGVYAALCFGPFFVYPGGYLVL